jgi:DNA-binding IclR family transcriptional regulator
LGVAVKLGLQSTLDRAIDILLTFDETHCHRTVEELAASVGFPKSTVYRYVRILQGKGFLARVDRSGTYALGPAVLRLARAMQRGYTLVACAAPVMRDLARRTNETILLSKLEGLDVVCLDRAEPQHNGLRISFEPGAILPIHASAPSKVLLAWSDPEVVEKVLRRGLKRYTPTTITDASLLLAELERVREKGYAVSNGELDPGILGLAVPVWGPSGSVVASLCVAAPTSRATVQDLLRHRPLLERAAEAIQDGLLE